MARADDKLRCVRLQIIDELTGEPLEYVNVRTNAKSVSFSDGAFLEDLMKSIKTNLSNVMVSDAKLRQTLQQHLDSNLHVVAEKLDKAIIGLDYNKETGVVTFERYDDDPIVWDTTMEHIPIDITFDKKTNKLKLITDKNPDGVEINLSSLVDIFEGEKTDDTTTRVTSENHILVSINEKGVKRVHLDEDVRASLLGAEEFIDKYEEKLEGIEENANNYSLPVATESVLGGIKPGFGLKTDETTGATTATNVMMGNTMEDAAPCGMFLEVQSIGGASTDPLPVMEESTSYITSEGDIIEYNPNSSLYTYTNASTDGSVENNLPKASVTAKFVNGLELIPLDTITWYTSWKTPYEYAVSPSGDGFIYNLENDVRTFVDYIDTVTFIQMFNNEELTEKVTG